MPDAAKTRREMLEQFAAANPTDAFARYGLALECSNAGDSPAAEQNFLLLRSSHPEYVPGYYHYGQLLLRLSRVPDAQSIFREGIEVAKKARDAHALSELEAALEESNGS